MADSLLKYQADGCRCGQGKDPMHYLYIGLDWHLIHEQSEENETTKKLDLTLWQLALFAYYRRDKYTIFKTVSGRDNKGHFTKKRAIPIAFGIPLEETKTILKVVKLSKTNKYSVIKEI